MDAVKATPLLGLRQFFLRKNAKNVNAFVKQKRVGTFHYSSFHYSLMIEACYSFVIFPQFHYHPDRQISINKFQESLKIKNMAEALPFVEFAANKLLTFLSEEGSLLGGLRLEIKLISDEFGHMKSFLQKVSDADGEDHDPQLSEWIRQVREVSQDTEGILDEFVLHFTSHRPAAWRFCSYVQWGFTSITHLRTRRRLATKLKDLKVRVKNIFDSRLRYESQNVNLFPRFSENVAAINAWSHRKDDDALLAEEVQLVGIAKPKHHLISHILDAEYHLLKVIAVLGMAGLGKTTVVKRVYDDAAVKCHFQIRAWFHVSQACDFQGLLKGLIQQVLSQFNESVPTLDSMSIYALKALLKDILQRGRYLIVFDDIWDTKLLDEFTFVFQENCYGGNRVILTTQKGDVASVSSLESHHYVYRMEFLNFQDSWTLFCRKTFKGKVCPTHLKNLAESIVRKCEGLPLGIVTIGGLLTSKDSSKIKEWELILHRLGDEFEGSGKLDRLKRILSLSFHDLSPTLKSCLLYTRIFPEDYKIPCRFLVNLWIAERFVEETEGQTAEDVGWDYLKELANRSLIQLNEVLYNGLYKYIHIHALLREFITTKSRERNMVTLLSTIQQTNTGWPFRKEIRRLVFDHNLPEIIISPERQHCVSNIRSIINFGEKKSPSKAVLNKLLTSKLLSVVQLRGIDLEEIPKEIFKSSHLKVLGISGEKIKTVPKSIKRLRNLEYLNLIGCQIKELPMEIQKLQKLRHIGLYQRAKDTSPGDFHYIGFEAPSGMGELHELRTLRILDVAESCKTGIVNEIGKLTKLRELWITKLRREDGKELCCSLEKLTNLQELVIASSHEKDIEAVTLDLNHPISASSLQSLCWLKLFGCLEKIPPWMGNLQGLERITLSLSNLTEDPLETLQHIPNLFDVTLIQAYKGESLRFKAGRFLKLKRLFLGCMKGLRCVRVEKGAMPGINTLIMAELPLVRELPFGIENLRQLQEVELWSMSTDLRNKLENAADSEEESEDSKRISHIPQVIIWSRQGAQWKCRQLTRRKDLKNFIRRSQVLKCKSNELHSSCSLFWLLHLPF
ncbi:OLC1v1031461C1 [Oldenlandia corymbosa var. corymbosa]|uniref:OLC1v1031461C1 n=1 Tax=Oldenlandia corymbosa var. corymbosa TaxID=529605 RepID=A0AAV1CJ91_OLDCO|nr:OLC1v1031461C1 [Oldenlandia corymbosa var. corymbosa]